MWFFGGGRQRQFDFWSGRIDGGRGGWLFGAVKIIEVLPLLGVLDVGFQVGSGTAVGTDEDGILWRGE